MSGSTVALPWRRGRRSQTRQTLYKHETIMSKSGASPVIETYSRDMTTTDSQLEREPIAVVIGATGAIGSATARLLRTSGWRVALLARDRDRVEALAADLGPGRSPSSQTPSPLARSMPPWPRPPSGSGLPPGWCTQSAPRC